MTTKTVVRGENRPLAIVDVTPLGDFLRESLGHFIGLPVVVTSKKVHY